MKSARIDTKMQLEALVGRLNAHVKRVAAKLTEVGEAPPAGGSAPPAASAAPVATPAAPKGTPAAPTEPTETPTEVPVGVAAIVDQLNSIRGGQSFKEAKVMDELKRYFDALDEGEQEALHAYLKGLAQIVSGQVDAGSAEEPSDHGVSTASSGKTTRTIKPSVTRKPSPANPAKAPAAVPISKVTSPSKENTAAPAPIVPKKRY